MIYLTKRLPKLFFLAYLEEEKFKKKNEKRKETFKNMTDKCYQSTYRIFKVDVSWVV